MTWEIELNETSAGANDKVVLPLQFAGDAPTIFEASITNVGVDPIMITRLGTTSPTGGDRYFGWFARALESRTDPFRLNPQESVSFQFAVFGRADPDVLEPGVFTGSVGVEWYLISEGSESRVFEQAKVTGTVIDTSLPDQFLTLEELFGERYWMHFPMGGQSRTGTNPFGLHPTIASTGYVDFFDSVQSYIDWCGVRPTIFIDRMTGNDFASGSDLPFDGVSNLFADDTPEMQPARDTFYEGFWKLGRMNCDVAVYVGSLANNSIFNSLASGGDYVGLATRMMQSLSPYLKLPNLRCLICDDPFGLSPDDARNQIYELFRKICQARGVSVLAEPRGTELRQTHLPEDGWGCCISYNYCQRTDPRWGDGPNGWPRFTGQMPTSRFNDQEFVQWHDGSNSALMAEQIVATVIDTVLEGRTTPIRYVTWPVPWRITDGKTAGLLLATVNVMLTQITVAEGGGGDIGGGKSV